MCWTSRSIRVFFIIIFLSACDSTVDQPGICISFDDRTIREWEQLSGLFDRYNAKVTFFITQFDSLSAEEVLILKKMKAKGHEIGSHGAIHVVSEHYIQEHGYSAYLTNEVDRSIAVMEKADLRPTSFAYPYGASFWFTDYFLLKRFDVLRGVAIKPDGRRISDVDDIFSDGDDNSVSALGFDYNSRLTRSDIDEGIERAIRENEVILFYAHFPGEDSLNPYSFDPELLEYMLNKTRLNDLKFYTVSELKK